MRRSYDIKAMLIDLDGVVYEGDDPVDGARDCLDWLERENIPHLFLTNTTSRPRSALVDKLRSMNISIHEKNILTPPIAAVQWLNDNVSGPVALFVAQATRSEFRSVPAADIDEPAECVVIGDYGDQWTYSELNRAFRLLMTEPAPRLLALGMTRYWLAPDGLRLDTGAFATALAYAAGTEPVVVGKPAKPFFDAALSILGVRAQQTIMIGDDLHADVGGAQASGIRGVLVRTGKFRPSDLTSEIRPAAVLDSLAELPAWFESDG